MLSHRRFIAVRPAVRAIAALALVAALLPWTIGPPAPVGADHSPTHDSVARIQILIKRITLHDDSEPWYEWDAEVSIDVVLHKVSAGCSPDSDGSYAQECLTMLAAIDLPAFDLGEDEIKTLNRMIPSSPSDSVVTDGSVTAEFGIPVYAGQTYLLAIRGSDLDFVDYSDYLGDVFRTMTEQNGWLVGAHNQRAVLDPRPSASGPPGHFSVEYEIRNVPLPDLEPTRIQTLDLPGSTNDLVCMGVLNRGAMDAGPFEAWLVLDGALPPIGKALAGGLGSGQYGDLCVEVNLPTTGQHYLTALVDEPRGIFEENDTNNRFAQPYAAARVAGDMEPQVGPSGVTQDTRSPGSGPFTVVAEPLVNQPAGVPNLEVKAIRVKGKEPTGNNDCDPGENDVTVVVKNEGTAAAANLLVRLTVGNQSKEKSATNLAADDEVNVRFDDLMLTRGQHKLTATANVPNPVALTMADDGKLEVTVNCANE